MTFTLKKRQPKEQHVLIKRTAHGRNSQKTILKAPSQATLASINNETHKNLTFSGCEMDLCKPILNLDINFSVEIPGREGYREYLDSIPTSTSSDILMDLKWMTELVRDSR